MRINSLTSAANSLLKKIRSLQERNARHKAGLFLIEGEKILLEALARGVEVEAVVLETDYFQKGISKVLEDALANEETFPESINLAPPNLFKDLITTTTSCGLVAAARPRTTALETVLDRAGSTPGPRRLVILEGVQDPGNLGSIMRSALAFDACGLILSRGTVDPYNPKVVRSAMGALFDLPVVVDADLSTALPAIKAAGFAVCSLNPEAAETLTDKNLPDKLALLLGNEGAGLTAEADALADFDLKIAINPQIESLNVSIAAAVVLFHLANVAKRS
ncbi:MAG: RNA methyltransferase [Cyanobacteria bacterium SZAS LIN-3]|nr:RNA methyltransferase [Cyanobacteria bacterium SZAS LIN-3]